MYRKLWAILVICSLFFVATACTSSSEEISDAMQATQPSTNEGIENTQQPTPKSTATIEPPTPTEPAKPTPVELILTGDQGFIQDSRLGVSLFSVENTNKTYAIENSSYQITIFDAVGTILSTDTGYITVVLPEEVVYVAHDFYLEEGQTADHIEVLVGSGTPEELDLSGGIFAVDQVEFKPDDYFPRVTGVITNSLSRNITDLRVTAVAFNQDGKIIGGGYSYLNFLAPNGKSAVDISITVKENPASVKLFPTLSGLSVFSEQADTEGGLMLLDYGFTQDKTSGGAAFLVQNTSSTSVFESTQYRVEAYDEAGTVLDTEEGYINIVFPGERQGVYTDLYLPDGTTISKVEVQINPRDPSTSQFPTNPFTIDHVKYQPGDYFNYVTSVITNSTQQSITDFEVVAVGYDEFGKIIGGGRTYVDFIPGQDSTGMKLNFNGSVIPTTLEVFSSMTSLSSIGSTNPKESVELVDFGYGIEGQSLGVGILVKNTESNSMVEYTRIMVTAYDIEGNVLDAESSSLFMIFPGQTIADSVDLSLPEGTNLDQVKVQILSGDSEPVPTLGYSFSVENINFIAGGYSNKATGIVKSALSKDIDNIQVVAIAFDANDKVIGSGFTYVDFIPANGQSAVEVSMTVSGTPARVEFYPLYTSLSNIDD